MIRLKRTNRSKFKRQCSETEMFENNSKSNSKIRTRLLFALFTDASFDRQSHKTSSKIFHKGGCCTTKTAINIRAKWFLFYVQKTGIGSFEGCEFPSAVHKNEFNRRFSFHFFFNIQHPNSVHPILSNDRVYRLVKIFPIFFSEKSS